MIDLLYTKTHKIKDQDLMVPLDHVFWMHSSLALRVLLLSPIECHIVDALINGESISMVISSLNVATALKMPQEYLHHCQVSLYYQLIVI